MSRLFAIAGLVAALALVACGDDDEPSADTPPATTAETAGSEPDTAAGDKQAEPAGGGGQKPATGTELVAADSEYRTILFDSEQQAIYLFDKETSAASVCYGDCAAAWPPVLTDGEPQAGAGADAKRLGTTERDDGSTQVTYAGHPLYYYAHEGPGQVLCHNVEEFGGLWLVVEPGGAAVS